VEKLIRRLENEQNEAVDLNSVDPLLVGSVLLQILQDLPEPLLSFQAYDSFLMLQYIQRHDEKVEISHHLLQSLPARPRTILHQLFALLIKLGDHEKLAGIFGPLILRPQKKIYYMNKDPNEVVSIVSFLIANVARYNNEDKPSTSPTLERIKGRSGSLGSFHLGQSLSQTHSITIVDLANGGNNIFQ